VERHWEDLRRPHWPRVPDWRLIYQALKRAIKRIVHPPRTVTFKKGGRYNVPEGERSFYDRAKKAAKNAE
jgi:hypothetical protein